MAHRLLRIARAIKQEAARVLIEEARDPRIGFVTVTRVKLSGDLSRAVILVSVMGTDAQKRTTMRGLDGARGFVQTAIARILKTRTTPHITFELDESIERSILFADMLKEIRDERGEEPDDLGDEYVEY